MTDRRLALAATLLLVVSACDGSDEEVAPCGSLCPSEPTAGAGSLCCEATAACIDIDLSTLCETGSVCRGFDSVTLDENCRPACEACEPAGLEPGLLATHLDAVVQDGGDMVISGYSPGVPGGARYGDLVVGRLRSDSSEIDWTIIDGVPEGTVPAEVAGWRGGVDAPGDDVGRWSSMVAAEDGRLFVAYYDQTNRALKLASESGGEWALETVDDRGDAGRYASLVLDGSTLWIAYLRIEPSDADPAALVSRVIVATAPAELTARRAGWRETIVSSEPMECRAGLCAAGEVCLVDTGRCEATSDDCEFPCASDEACVNASCQDVLTDDFVEDLDPAHGLYVRLAATPDGLATIFYDRARGNLWGAAYRGSAWGERFLIDGSAAGSGDAGLAGSLFVDPSGTWHVSYVDPSTRSLRYARILDEAVVLRGTVDDGSELGGTRYEDGRHRVGDDSAMVVAGWRNPNRLSGHHGHSTAVRDLARWGDLDATDSRWGRRDRFLGDPRGYRLDELHHNVLARPGGSPGRSSAFFDSLSRSGKSGATQRRGSWSQRSVFVRRQRHPGSLSCRQAQRRAVRPYSRRHIRERARAWRRRRLRSAFRGRPAGALARSIGADLESSFPPLGSGSAHPAVWMPRRLARSQKTCIFFAALADENCAAGCTISPPTTLRFAFAFPDSLGKTRSPLSNARVATAFVSNDLRAIEIHFIKNMLGSKTDDDDEMYRTPWLCVVGGLLRGSRRPHHCT